MVFHRTADVRLTPEATEFVRFCYRRRAVGWPELYDEMCAVAGRGLFRGWGATELAEQGVGFSLDETPALAALVARVVADEQAHRSHARPPTVPRMEPTTEPSGSPRRAPDRPPDLAAVERPGQLAAAPAS